MSTDGGIRHPRGDRERAVTGDVAAAAIQRCSVERDDHDGAAAVTGKITARDCKRFARLALIRAKSYCRGARQAEGRRQALSAHGGDDGEREDSCDCEDRESFHSAPPHPAQSAPGGTCSTIPVLVDNVELLHPVSMPLGSGGPIAPGGACPPIARYHQNMLQLKVICPVFEPLEGALRGSV